MFSKIQNSLNWIYVAVFPDASHAPHVELRYTFFVFLLIGLIASSAALAVGIHM